MDKGNVESVGRPYDLIKDKTTILHDLVHSLDKSESERLIEIAKKSLNKYCEKSVNILNPIKENNSNANFVEVALDTEEPRVLITNEEKESFLSKKT